MSTPTSHAYTESMCAVTSAADVGDVLKSKHFASARHGESGEFVGGTVLVLDGDAHFERRRIQSALFARDALKRYETRVLAPVIERQLHQVAECGRGPDGVVRADLVTLSRAMLLQIAAAVIGLDGVTDDASTDRLNAYLGKLIEGTTVEWSAKDHAEVVRIGLEARRHFDVEYVTPARVRREQLLAAWRAGQIAESELPTDLLTQLLRHQSADWDADLILRECVLYLVASTLTTSSAITHVIRELTGWLAEHPADRQRLLDGDFQRRVCAEALRLHPPTQALARRATSDVSLHSGRGFQPGDLVAPDLVSANRDPDVFGADADTFNPHREPHHRMAQYGFAFGGGVHVCIGRPLVLASYPDAGEEVDGILVRLLKALYAAGVALDPAAPPEQGDAGHDRYTRFPIRLDTL